MTTALDTTVIVEPSGLTYVCAWCVPRARLIELGRLYAVSHSMCTACAATFVSGGRAAP